MMCLLKGYPLAINCKDDPLAVARKSHAKIRSCFFLTMTVVERETFYMVKDIASTSHLIRLK